MVESFSREKSTHAPQKKGRKVDEKSCVTPAGTSNELVMSRINGKKKHNTPQFFVLPE